MNVKRIFLLMVATALMAVPAIALADPGNGKGKPEQTAPKGKAYGKYCQGESKKHVEGEKGTAFSRCVKAMRAADRGASPKAACKGLSKKHVKGEKGTPYSRCIVAAAKVKKDGEAEPTPTETPAGPTGPTGPTP
jgi:hypothetical protein